MRKKTKHQKIVPYDFWFADCGSIWLVTPQNDLAVAHLHANAAEEALWHGGALVVEPRYVADLAQGLQDNGFTVGR